MRKKAKEEEALRKDEEDKRVVATQSGDRLNKEKIKLQARKDKVDKAEALISEQHRLLNTLQLSLTQMSKLNLENT